jgi:hypothetical protein
MPINDRKPQRNFTGGEQSPMLDARADLERFATSLSAMENFVVLPWGGAEKSPGSRFAHESLPNSKLIGFAASDADGYAIEFGTNVEDTQGYARFFRDFGIVLNDANQVLRLNTPYLAADIPNLRGAQITDTMYLVHGGRVHRLLHADATHWNLREVTFKRGPFRDLNSFLGISLFSTAEPEYEPGDTIDINIHYDNGPNDFFKFSEDMVGSLLLIRTDLNPAHKTWQPDAPGISEGDGAIWNNNTYICTGAFGANTGVNPPTHTVYNERRWDGLTSDASHGRREWRFLHAGYGVARITEFVSEVKVMAEVTMHVPDDLHGLDNDGGTVVFAEGAWSDKYGWPRRVATHGGRLIFGATVSQPNTYWASAEDDYENFDEGKGLATDAFQRTLLGNNKIHAIEWFVSGTRLAIGTTGDEFVIQGSATREALTPENATTLPATDEGSAPIEPVKIGSPVWVSPDHRRVHLMGYDFQSDDFEAPDLTEAAEHITGTGLVALAWQRVPYQVLWAAREDGALIGLTYRKAQNVLGWHRHPRNGRVKSLCVVPNPNGKSQDLWLKVEHDLPTGTKTYVEALEHFFNRANLARTEPERVTRAFFVECGSIYSGVPATVMGGLAYLEGLEVAILADGQVVPNQIVAQGKITLPHAASYVVAGRPYSGRLVSLRYDRDFDGGASSGRKRRVAAIALDLFATALGINVADGESTHTEVVLPTAGMNMNLPVPLFTGITDAVPLPGNWDKQGRFSVISDLPLPATVRGFTPTIQVSS